MLHWNKRYHSTADIEEKTCELQKRHNQLVCERKMGFAAVFTKLTIFIRYSSCQDFLSLHVTAIVLKTTRLEGPELSSQISPSRLLFLMSRVLTDISTQMNITLFSLHCLFFSSTYQNKISILSVLLLWKTTGCVLFV